MKETTVSEITMEILAELKNSKVEITDKLIEDKINEKLAPLIEEQKKQDEKEKKEKIRNLYTDNGNISMRETDDMFVPARDLESINVDVERLQEEIKVLQTEEIEIKNYELSEKKDDELSEKKESVLQDFSTLLKNFKENALEKTFGKITSVYKSNMHPALKMVSLPFLTIPTAITGAVSLTSMAILLPIYFFYYPFAKAVEGYEEVAKKIKKSTSSFWKGTKSSAGSGNFFKILISGLFFSVVMINGLMFLCLKGVMIPLKSITKINQIIGSLASKALSSLVSSVNSITGRNVLENKIGKLKELTGRNVLEGKPGKSKELLGKGLTIKLNGKDKKNSLDLTKNERDKILKNYKKKLDALLKEKEKSTILKGGEKGISFGNKNALFDKLKEGIFLKIKLDLNLNAKFNNVDVVEQKPVIVNNVNVNDAININKFHAVENIASAFVFSTVNNDRFVERNTERIVEKNNSDGERSNNEPDGEDAVNVKGDLLSKVLNAVEGKVKEMLVPSQDIINNRKSNIGKDIAEERVEAVQVMEKTREDLDKIIGHDKVLQLEVDKGNDINFMDSIRNDPFYADKSQEELFIIAEKVSTFRDAKEDLDVNLNILEQWHKKNPDATDIQYYVEKVDTFERDQERENKDFKEKYGSFARDMVNDYIQKYEVPMPENGVIPHDQFKEMAKEIALENGHDKLESAAIYKDLLERSKALDAREEAKTEMKKEQQVERNSFVEKQKEQKQQVISSQQQAMTR